MFEDRFSARLRVDGDGSGGGKHLVFRCRQRFLDAAHDERQRLLGVVVGDAGEEVIDDGEPGIELLGRLCRHGEFSRRLTGEKVVACGANEKVLGILQNKPNGSTNQATARVRILGNSKLSIAETVAFGNYLTSTAASKGEVADAANEELGAKSLTSGESGDLIDALIWHGKDTDGNG